MHLASVSEYIFGSCCLILFISSTNSIQLVRLQCCLLLHRQVLFLFFYDNDSYIAHLSLSTIQIVQVVFYWSPKVVSVWWDWNNLVPPILNRDNIFKAWKKLNHFISLQKERKTFQVCAQRPVPSFSNANSYPQPPISEWSVGWDGSKMYSCSQAVALKSLSPFMIGETGLHGGTSLFEP